ncbi:MCE family protein, partial [Mycobacterium sp.]|uniref:MCE family protein n=1 Tax=Mycobacterium sp. TaxID=1785 RepID=UPI003C72052B
MTAPRGKENKAPVQPYRVAGVIVFLIAALVLWVVFLFYKGDFSQVILRHPDKTQLTMLSDRAGLVMDPGSKVTYDGVQIGRVAKIDEKTQPDGKPFAKFTLDVDQKYLQRSRSFCGDSGASPQGCYLIPANVEARIVATTVFGGKYVAFTAPDHPSPQKITTQTAPHTVIDARSVTTEINTLFQTITSIAEKVDPVKVNLTLSAAAQALSGLGDKFGQSLINGSESLDEINPRMPTI